MTLNRIKNLLENKWLEWQYTHLACQTAFDPSHALVVSGDPRGGTTWLAEMLQQLPKTALLWEPLVPTRVLEFGRLGFAWRQYIPETESWPEAHEAFRMLFAGKLLNSYLCRSTTPTEIRSANHLLVKFCRANQLLPWLTVQFQFKYAPIYLVRHPCAVVASQLKKGGWDHVTPQFIIPKGRYSSFYSEHAEFLASVDTIEKRLAATWCLCNQVPLRHPSNNVRWITITYESLLQDGEKELKRISERWGIEFPDALYASVFSASTTTVKGSPIENGNAQGQLSYWKKRLSKKQTEDIFSVLRYFGVDLYGPDELPQYNFHD